MIPSIFYSKEIYSYCEELVKFGAKSYDMLYDNEKHNLAIRVIKVLGSDAFEMLTGEDDCDTTLNCLSKFLSTSSKDDAFELLNQIRLNAVNRYAYVLDLLIQEIVSKNNVSRMYEAGFMPIVDAQNGELSWRKRA